MSKPTGEAVLAEARGSGATYELWKHMADTHNVMLLESEVWDIVSIAKKLLTGTATDERHTFCAVCNCRIHMRKRLGEVIWTHTVPKGQRKMPRCKTPTPSNNKLRHAAPDARNATDGQCGVA